MDIDKVSFPGSLLDILESIANAHSIALDFELSGIPENFRSAQGRTKQSMQDKYETTKLSAEKFQILQVGLTCILESGGSFTLETYNFPLNPILDDDLDVPRDFTLQGGAVAFLLRHNFNFQKLFRDGIPYLSRQEEIAGLEKAKERGDRSRIEDIQLTEEETEAHELQDTSRKAIQAWLQSEDSRRARGNVIIDCHVLNKRTLEDPFALSGLQKRLIHQLIRSEFPELLSIPNHRSGGIMVKKRDEERERREDARRLEERREAVKDQIGFRWVMEALCGGSIKEMNLRKTSVNLDGSYKEFDFYATVGRQGDIIKKLQQRRPALVGHNLFMDLVYLHRCFIGELPQKVEEFSAAIHSMFPTVIDTKYLATAETAGLNPTSSLEQIHESLLQESVPKMTMQPGFNKYHNKMSFHEAGFDSLLTAQVMLRLSAKLAKAKGHDVSDAVDLNSRFWNDMSNRLRVFGTTETCLHIGDGGMVKAEDGGIITKLLGKVSLNT